MKTSTISSVTHKVTLTREDIIKMVMDKLGLDGTVLAVDVVTSSSAACGGKGPYHVSKLYQDGEVTIDLTVSGE